MRPSSKAARIAPDNTTVKAEVLDLDVPIEKERRRHAVVNKQVANGIFSKFSFGGASNAVTPIPHYLPAMTDLDWFLGAAAVIKALLDSDGGFRHKQETFTTFVEERIDANDFLPTSYDDMREWRTIIGTATRPARR